MYIRFNNLSHQDVVNILCKAMRILLIVRLWILYEKQCFVSVEQGT